MLEINHAQPHEPGDFHYKVFEDSVEFQTTRDAAREVAPPLDHNPYIYGSGMLRAIDTLEEKGVQPGSPEYDVEKKRIVSNFLNMLEKHLSSDSFTHAESERLFNAVVRLFSESLSDPDVSHFIKTKLGQDNPQATALATDLNQGVLNVEVFEASVRHHIKEQKNREEQFKGVVERVKSNYRQKLKLLQQKYEIVLSDDVLDQRFEHARIYLADSIVTAREKLSIASSHGLSEELVVTPEAASYGIEHVLDHELTHIASGVTIVSQSSDEAQLARRGLRFYEADPELHAGRSGMWLNEAVTESIAIECDSSTAENVNGYAEERELFELLLAKGSLQLNKDIFYKAYFENYYVGNKKGVPLFNQLTKMINSSYGSNFLTD